MKLPDLLTTLRELLPGEFGYHGQTIVPDLSRIQKLITPIHLLKHKVVSPEDRKVRGPGVYLIYKGCSIVYVGCSEVRMLDRLRCHLGSPTNRMAQKIQALLQGEDPELFILPCLSTQAMGLEAVFLSQLQPPANRFHRNTTVEMHTNRKFDPFNLDLRKT